MPLQTVTDVMKRFKNYTDIPHIAQLATEVCTLTKSFVFAIYLYICVGKTTSRIISNPNNG